MTSRVPFASSMKRQGVAVLSALALGLGLVSAPLPAHAAGTLTVSTPQSGVAENGATTVTVSGSGYQSIQGGFGGIYVLFGWVSDPNGGSWKPSNGGATGETYRYAYDDETNPQGYQSLVAFPGSATGYAANGGQIGADGTWSTTLIIPGAKFTSYDRNGNPTEVDCMQVQCGVFTIGAHGVVNANNETFTPVSFVAGATAEEAAPTEAATQDAAAPAPAQSAAGNGASAATASRPATAVPAAPAAYPESISLSWSSLLWIIASILAGVTLLIVAAGWGGYLAVKAIILGVHPASLERECARRQLKADRIRIAAEKRRAAYLAKHGLSDDESSAPAPRASALGRMDGEGRAQETQVMPALPGNIRSFYEAEGASPASAAESVGEGTSPEDAPLEDATQTIPAVRENGSAEERRETDPINGQEDSR